MTEKEGREQFGRLMTIEASEILHGPGLQSEWRYRIEPYRRLKGIMKLSHLDQAGRARMVDVGDKPLMDPTAVATGTIRMSREAFQQVAEQAVAKGDVLAVSEVAGTLAAKKTAELIPLCHPLGLDHVEVEASLAESLPGVRIWATVRAG